MEAEAEAVAAEATDDEVAAEAVEEVASEDERRRAGEKSK